MRRDEKDATLYISKGHQTLDPSKGHQIVEPSIGHQVGVFFHLLPSPFFKFFLKSTNLNHFELFFPGIIFNLNLGKTCSCNFPW